MSRVVLEVGPATVRGPHPVDPELAATAVQFIDDEVALVAEQPHPVSGLWRQLLAAAAGPDPPSLLLICPSWWSRARVQRVIAAAPAVTGAVEVSRRADLLGARISRADGAVVEVAPDHIAVCAAGSIELIARSDDVAAVREEVTAALGRPTAVLIDTPAEVPGASALAEALADRLRRSRIAVSVVQPDRWEQSAEPPPAPEPPGRSGLRHPAAPAPRLTSRSGAVAAGAVLAVLGLAAGLVLPAVPATRPT